MPYKNIEADDPMELVGIGFPDGDPELAAACIVEEFILLGMGDDELLRVFKSPFYAGAHAIYRARGESYVQTLIELARKKWGYPRFATSELPDERREKIQNPKSSSAKASEDTLRSFNEGGSKIRNPEGEE